MEVRIKDDNGYVDADWIIENGIMVVSPKVEKFEPKDGDVVFVKGALEHILIYKEEKSENIVAYADLVDSILSNVSSHAVCKANVVDLRPATEEEKKKLFDKLKEEGYEWNSEKKELVRLKWKPKYREPYFVPFFSNVDFLFSTCGHTYTAHFSDELTIKQTIVFKTEVECQDFCNRLNNAINQVKP